MIDTEAIGALRDRYAHCFGCGPSNPVGLQLTGFRSVGGSVVADFRPRAEYAGFDDTLHGGVIATALDEGSAWAALLTYGLLVFTARLDIRYRRQARTGVSYEVAGTITERRGRRLLIDAAISDDDGVVASSSGLFIVADEYTEELTDRTDSTASRGPSDA